MIQQKQLIVLRAEDSVQKENRLSSDIRKFTLGKIDITEHRSYDDYEAC